MAEQIGITSEERAVVRNLIDIGGTKVAEAAILAQLIKVRESQVYEKSLEAFIKAGWESIEPGNPLGWNWYMTAICEHLEAVLEGDIKRLIINVPPRSLKSTICSVMFPAWTWTWLPEAKFLTLSHRSALAVRDAVRTRRVISSPWYQLYWGRKVRLTGDQNEKSRYQNMRSGFRISMGLDGQITGDGGDIIIVDDPHDASSVNSQADRERVIETLDRSVSTRLNNPARGAIIMVMQRLHPSDATAHLLAGAEKWEHLVIPAEYDAKVSVSTYLPNADPRRIHGESIDPERYPRSALTALKTRLGTFDYNAQFQQTPLPEGGGIFKAHWFNRWPDQRELPTMLMVIQSLDCAYGTKESTTNSWTVNLTWGLFILNDGTRAFLLLEDYRSQDPYYKMRKAMIAQYQKHRPDLILVENKASGISIFQDLAQMGAPVRKVNVDKDKVARAEAVSALVENGKVWVPQRLWADEYIAELCAFSAKGSALADDRVDATTQLLEYAKKKALLEHSELIKDEFFDRPPLLDTEENREDYPNAFSHRRAAYC